MRGVGLFVQTPHPVVVEVLSACGVDLLCIDQEHAPIGIESLHGLIGSATVPVLVRVPACTAHHIGAALDAGADGVLVPRVSSAAEAADAVAFARYPPAGRRGLGPGRAAAYGRHIARELREANERVLVAVQIETADALEALDEILDVDGVDLVFVGPGDLGASLGVENVDDVASDVLERARSRGRATGMFAADAAGAAAWLERGVSLVLFGSDLGFLAAAVERAWRGLPNRPETP